MSDENDPEFNLECPVPRSSHDRILLAHGGGGQLSRRLLERLFVPAFRNPYLEARHDGALLPPPGGRLAFTTDSHVVSPLFFPGGDIGSLSIYGTVNDLAMCGARPLYLSAGFILEEGMPMATLERVVGSMKAAAEAAGVVVVTGDTKVVERGKGDGLYLNTAGVGVIDHGLTLAPSSVRPGDAVLLSGDVGRHGMAVMAVREGLSFETTLESDCAPVVGPALALIDAGLTVHCLRDLTRGGLATALVEIVEGARLELHIAEAAVPVCDAVAGACELLGLDPLYVACEGRFVAFLPEEEADRGLEVLHRSGAPNAVRIGTVTGEATGRVIAESRIGAARLLDLLSGEQLPRIC